MMPRGKDSGGLLRGNQGFKDKIWRFFSSVKLTIFILIILAVTSISGTLIAQKASPEAYIKAFGESGYRIIKALGLYDVYHSWWFVSILAFLSLNLIVCSLDRFPRAWRFIRHPDKWPSVDALEAYQQSAVLSIFLTSEEAANVVSHEIKAKGFKCEKKTEGNAIRLFAQKGVINRLSVYITHLSVLIILLGGIVDGLFGFSGSMTIVEGESSRNVILFGTNKRITLPFDVKCESFEIEYYENTKIPKEYRSTITILDKGVPVLTKVIRVNHPLRFKGIKFYQASYGTLSTNEGVLNLAVTSAKREFTVKVKVGESVPLEDGYRLRFVAFYPDLVLGPGNQPMSRSNELRNPAALLEVDKGDEMLYRSWVFAFYPNIHSLKNVPFRFRYLSFKALQYTGLQVSKDPGVWIVWVGCVLILIGLITTFFISHRRIWVYIEDKGKKRRILLAATANKNLEAFSHVFNDLVKGIEERLKSQRR